MSEETEVQDEGEVEANEAITFQDSPVFKAMQAQMDRMAAQLVEKDAIAFADSVTKGKEAKAYPAERKTIIDGYKRAAQIDARLPEAITFADGAETRQGSHLDAFKAMYSVRPRVTVRDEKAIGFTDLPEEPATSNRESEEKAREARKAATLAWKAQQGSSVG